MRLLAVGLALALSLPLAFAASIDVASSPTTPRVRPCFDQGNTAKLALKRNHMTAESERPAVKLAIGAIARALAEDGSEDGAYFASVTKTTL